MNIEAMTKELASPDREGCTTWLYCDSRGFPTIGVGNLVARASDAVDLPFCHMGSGATATDDEKQSAWTVVTNAFARGRGATYYKPLTNLRISEDFAFQLAAKRLTNEFIPGIKRLCHDFDSWPEPAQRAIVDMAYNLGVGGLSHFVNFLGACQDQDWITASRHCHRITCRDSRNDWTRDMFLAAAAEEKGSR